MKLLTIAITIVIITACTTSAPSNPTPYPTYTPYPTSTPYPTPTPSPLAETFLNTLHERIQTNDIIPANGRDPILALTDSKETFAFERGLILQLIVDVPETEDGFQKTAVLLIGNVVNYPPLKQVGLASSLEATG